MEVARGSPDHRAGLFGTAFDAGKAELHRAPRLTTRADAPCRAGVFRYRGVVWTDTRSSAMGGQGGQPGKPKPPGNPPVRQEPQRPQPIEEPPRPLPVPPVERPP